MRQKLHNLLNLVLPFEFSVNSALDQCSVRLKKAEPRNFLRALFRNTTVDIRSIDDETSEFYYRWIYSPRGGDVIAHGFLLSVSDNETLIRGAVEISNSGWVLIALILIFMIWAQLLTIPLAFLLWCIGTILDTSYQRRVGNRCIARIRDTLNKEVNV